MSTRSPSRAPALLRWLSIAVILIGLFLIVRALPVARGIELLRAWVDGLGFLGVLVFAAAYVLAAMLFIPGSALTLAAGAVFGLGLGTVVVSITSTLAAGLAFLVARYLARPKIEELAGKYPKFKAIDNAIGQGGWRIIALLRLSPAMPYSASNYLYGLSQIRFVPYVIASWLAMLPGTFMYVYLGYVGTQGLSAVGEDEPAGGAGKTVLLVVGLLATIVVTVYVTRLATRALREQTAKADESGAGESSATQSGGPTTPQSPAAKPLFARLALPLIAMVLLAAGLLAQANRNRLQSLLGPPGVAMQESYEGQTDGPRVDHSAFDALLRAHVDGDGLVDYAALGAEAAQLDAYIATLATVDFDELGRDEKLAFLINAYNAFTLRLILDNRPLESIRDIPSADRWDAVRWELAGETVSLNQIEHEWVRPHFREARIHFALVCAARGCPPLRAEAYDAARLEEQLTDQAQRVHEGARWFEYDEEQGVVRLTALYDWYGGDFRQLAGSVLSFAAPYSPRLTAAVDSDRAPRVEWLDYDWSLNSQSPAQ